MRLYNIHIFDKFLLSRRHVKENKLEKITNKLNVSLLGEIVLNIATKIKK